MPFKIYGEKTNFYNAKLVVETVAEKENTLALFIDGKRILSLLDTGEIFVESDNVFDYNKNKIRWKPKEGGK